jgi:uncharacterized membrane protein HdeD (DUF308 family)
MATDVIRSAYRQTWWGLVLRGLLALAVGVLILWRPLQSVAALALVIAIWALFAGIVQIVHAFDLRHIYDRWWVLLLSGLVGVVFGVAALAYYPTLSLAFVVVWAAWWLILTGALAIYAAIEERRLGQSWGWTLVFGIVSILAGVFAVMSPPVTLTAIMALIAGFAIVSGLVLLVGAFKLSSLRRDVAGAVGAARV